MKFKDFRKNTGSVDPPVILVMRRKAIRMLPGNQRVALYTNENLGLEFTLPYSTDLSTQKGIAGYAHKINQDSEGYSLHHEAAIHLLHHANKNKSAAELIFRNGTKGRVPHTTASLVMRLHAAVNGPNKKKIEDLINDSPASLAKVTKFAQDNIK